MTATGTDGTKYTLVVPAGALFGEETVTMTPLASATGLPLSGGLIGAVHLAPEGLQFQEIAVLTIEPAVALQGKKIHAFGYEGTGTDFHLQPVRTNGTALTVGIMHFSGEGLGEGIVSPYTGPTRSHEFVALVRLADLEDLGRVPTADELASVFGDWLSGINVDLGGIPELLDAAIDDFSSWKAHIAEYPGMEARFNLLRRATEAQLIAAVGRAVDDAYAQCKSENDVTHAFDMLRWVLRVQKLGLGDSLAAPTWDKVDACVRFELTFTSTNIVDQDTPPFRFVYRTEVLSVVKLSVQRNLGVELSLTGHDDLVATTARVDCSTTAGIRCEAKIIPNKGRFTVVSSSFGIDVTKQAHLPPTHLELRVRAESGDIAATIETTLHFEDGSSSSSGALPAVLWYPAFYYAHNADREGVEFKIKDWEVTGGANFATKTFTNLTPPPIPAMTVTEPETRFVLKHKPQ